MKIDMLDLKMLKKNNIDYNWCTLYVGIKLNYFNFSILTDYAIEIIKEFTNIEDLFLKLIDDINEDEKDEVLSKINDHYCHIISDKDEKWIIQSRKLRLAFLKYLTENLKDTDNLLNAIAVLYENLDYPKDMESFIYYMPPKDTVFYENPKDGLIENLLNFIKSEESELIK